MLLKANCVSGRILKNSASVAALLVALSWSLGAAAQELTSSMGSDQSRAVSKTDKSSPVEEVTVTGSHISGNPVSGAMLTTIDRDDLEKGGFTDLGQAMRSIPENFGGGLNPETSVSAGTGDNADQNRPGVSSPNLRGLGSGATLTLLNGHRLPPAGQGLSVDLSLIPLAAIERVDVLADGASAIYGADAVAGVVNIITRRTFDGVEARAQYGGAAGGLGTYTASLLGGEDFGRLSAVFGAQYFNQSSLSASTRRRSQLVALPTTLAGDVKTASLFGSLSYKLSDQIELYSDAVFSQNNGNTINTNVSHTTIYQFQSNSQYMVTGGAKASLWSDWTLDVSGTQSQSIAKYPFRNTNSAGVVSLVTLGRDRGTTMTTIDGTLSGNLFDLPGGAVKAAFGAEYRKENYSSESQALALNRDVNSIFAEFQVPIVGRDNRLPLIYGLSLNLAARRDDYSDFGAVAVPKVSLSWELTDELTAAGSYSNSFRAPTLFDRTPNYFAAVANIPDPASSTGITNALYLGGTGGPVGAERARSINVNVTYVPGWLDGLRLSLAYYRVDYTDRIANPDPSNAFAFNLAGAPADLVTRGVSQAQIQALLNGAASSFALAGGAVNITGVNTIVDMRNTNIAVSKINGLQGELNYQTDLAGGTLALSMNVAYIDDFTDQLRAGLAPVARAGIIYSPAKLRSRGGAEWSSGAVQASVFWNHTDGYLDNRIVATPLNVGSWDTVDGSLSYDLGGGLLRELDGVKATVSVTNLFDTDPPQTAAINKAEPFQYDPTNASIIGRFTSIAITKKW